jgi:cyanophycinase-like exopeptidase
LVFSKLFAKIQCGKNMKFSCLCLIFCLTAISGRAQNYTSYFTGNSVDLEAQPSGGVCLMGGATEDDNAMRWFLQRSGGGDILVLRATGSNGYNTYLYSELGVQVNSVETIVCNNLAASSDPYVLQKIDRAEAIWFAGGNQWTYQLLEK